MIATSVPYWGLRDYGLGDNGLGLESLHDCLAWATGGNCGECYVCHMRLFAAECWRVLRDDGTFWLNLGDSYNAGRNGGHAGGRNGISRPEIAPGKSGANAPGLKPKDLCLIPARVALALQADGWWLRSDIIWAKSNPMPESVKDRPTKAHEYVFLLTKSKRYFYDQDAIREPLADATLPRALRGVGDDNKWLEGAPGSTAHTMSQPRPNKRKDWEDNHGGSGTGFNGHSGYYSPDGRLLVNPNGRNKWTVWNVPTVSYPGAHFATWPPALVEPMIKAGTSERGCCPECGSQWERVTEKGEFIPMRWSPGIDKTTIAQDQVKGIDPNGRVESNTSAMVRGGVNERITTGWKPTCDHNHSPVPCTVLDPFAGSGTTGQVARELGRDAILLDLSFDYLSEQAKSRLDLDLLESWGSGIPDPNDYSELFKEALIEP
jgi:DNA modification methylase